MLNELINSKHAGNPTEYMNIEEKILEQSIMLKELQQKNEELNTKLEQKIREEANAKERISEITESLSKIQNKPDKTAKYKKKIEEFEIKLAELQGNLEKVQKEHDIKEKNKKQPSPEWQKQKEEMTKAQNEVQAEISRSGKVVEDYKNKYEASKQKSLEWEKERKNADENLKKLEQDLESKLNQLRSEQQNKLTECNIFLIIIILVEREYDQKKKQQADLAKPKEIPAVIPKVQKNIVEEEALYYIKLTIRAKLINSRINKEKLMQVIFPF